MLLDGGRVAAAGKREVENDNCTEHEPNAFAVAGALASTSGLTQRLS
ncbi:hypothetical protein [Polyangium jinanense]|uniref:Uncharacterized protein n=1 Tax=Polyangium jinanense TaxID=2829994 RepID=A0A9X4AXR9_9BACT|nr:hypothetical protein [Polyangium jinanense]MDC3962108.1 hypothetical protein [Polyangium jinanense]MDC3988729.1 hypothetical protein [Polyangium jinanense]